MPNRRSFIKLSALASGSLALGQCGISTPEDVSGSAPFADKAHESTPAMPRVVSTWAHGMPANAAAWEVLSKAGLALDAVEMGVRVTEADLKNRSVGLGGSPDREGRVTLDACIMDHSSRCGAVAFLEHIAHPVSVARAIMERTPHVMLVGQGAYDWAMGEGFERSALEVPVAEAREAWKEWLEKGQYRPKVNVENHDTIGMLAIDANGRLGGACTTSGMAYKIHGRVGDSPLIGSGLFVDSDAGAAVATGVGEAVIRVAGSSAVVELMRQGATPQDACEEVVKRILRKHPDIEGLQVGFLAMDKEGRCGAYSVYSGFNYALTDKQSHALVDAPYAMEWK